MSDQTTPTGPKTRLVLCTYYKSNLASIQKLVSQTPLADHVALHNAVLTGDEPIEGDIALALVGARDPVDDYLTLLPVLKDRFRIPVVIVMIHNEHKERLADRVASLPADQVFFFPLAASEFSTIIMTHVASLQIHNESRKSRVDPSRTQRLLGEVLVENHIISAEQLDKALEYQKGAETRLGELLVMLGFISEEQKIHFLAGQLGVEVATARQYASADLTTVGIIPEHLSKRYNCIALERSEERLVVAMDDVINLQLLDILRDISGLSIKPVLGTIDDIKTSIERYYRDIASQKDASSLIADLDENVEYVQQDLDDMSVEEAAAAGAELGIIKLVNLLITNAVRDRASDIHLEPMEKSVVVRYRIDGELRRVMSPPKRSHQAIITRIKILSDLNIAERRLPQDGRMVARIGHREVDIRVSILPTVFGEKAVLRILDKEAFEKSVANLGFSGSDLETFKQNVTKPHGMIIVTGPTGSGKSTTLYSAIQSIKNVVRNIVTVEDPVEFHMEGVNQVHINSKIGLTFASALRSILRQDPDVVLIGEIRDAETADIAIKMALTGHLVFSTLHTNDAASTVARFVDIGIPPLLLASSLNLIIAQRLVRRVCQKCRVGYTPDAELLDQLNLKGRKDITFYRGEGCVSCNGVGYSGRTGLFEMLQVSKQIKTMILRGAGTLEIQAQAEKEGMHTLRQAGLDLAMKGMTTIEQVIAATTEI